MASATWSLPRSELTRSRARVFDSGLDDRGDARGLLEDDEEDDASDSEGSAAAPPLFRRLMQSHQELLNAAQETLLLLLIGIAANLLAFVLDHLIELLVSARAHAAQAEDHFLPSYAVWTGSALLCCTFSAMCVQFIGPASAGSGIPQMKSVLGGAHGGFLFQKKKKQKKSIHIYI